MTEIACDFFAHPLPKLLNGIKVWAIGREPEKFNTKILCLLLYQLTTMPGGAIPDDDKPTLGGASPLYNALQECRRVFTVAFAFMPEQCLSCCEVIGAVPVDARRERGGDALAPGYLTHRRPGVTKVHILMEMRFVHVDDIHLSSNHLGVERLELFDKCSPLLWFGSGQQFLAFLPTQPRRFEDLPQRIPADLALQHRLDPAAQLLDGPIVTWQPMLAWLARLNGQDNGGLLGWQKREDLPPVRR